MQAVEDLLSLEFYRFKRYKIPITLVLVETDHKDFFEMAEATIRKTDLIQQIDKHLYAILYSHTDRIGSQSAVNNILSKLKTQNGLFRMAIEEGRLTDQSEHELVNRAFEYLFGNQF